MTETQYNTGDFVEFIDESVAGRGPFPKVGTIGEISRVDIDGYPCVIWPEGSVGRRFSSGTYTYHPRRVRLVCGFSNINEELDALFEEIG